MSAILAIKNIGGVSQITVLNVACSTVLFSNLKPLQCSNYNKFFFQGDNDENGIKSDNEIVEEKKKKKRLHSFTYQNSLFAKITMNVK